MALQLIEQGKLEEADLCYQKTMEINRLIHYYDGIAVTYFNMANLEAIKGNIIEAVKFASAAVKMKEKVKTGQAPYLNLLQQLVQAAIKEGMVLERKGELTKALSYYKASLPHAEGEYQQALHHEIALIERVIENGQGKNSSNP